MRNSRQFAHGRRVRRGPGNQKRRIFNPPLTMFFHSVLQLPFSAFLRQSLGQCSPSVFSWLACIFGGGSALVPQGGGLTITANGLLSRSVPTRLFPFWKPKVTTLTRSRWNPSFGAPLFVLAVACLVCALYLLKSYLALAPQGRLLDSPSSRLFPTL